MLVRYAEWDDGRDSEHGLEGWRPLWLGGRAEPSSHLGHDVIDHMPGDAPTIEQELMALGCWLYTRGENGIGTEYVSSTQTLRQEISVLRRCLFDRDGCRLQTPVALRWSAFPEGTLDTLRDAVRGGIDDHISEMSEALDDDEEVAAFEACPGEAEVWRTWLALGYRRAQRRFKAHDSYSVGMLTNAISERTARLGDEHGSHLRIQVDLQSLDFRVEAGALDVYDASGRRFIAY